MFREERVAGDTDTVGDGKGEEVGDALVAGVEAMTTLVIVIVVVVVVVVGLVGVACVVNPRRLRRKSTNLPA